MQLLRWIATFAYNRKRIYYNKSEHKPVDTDKKESKPTEIDEVKSFNVTADTDDMPCHYFKSN